MGGQGAECLGIWIPRRMQLHVNVDCGCQREDIDYADVFVVSIGPPPVRQVQKLMGKECTLRRQITCGGEVEPVA